MRYLPGMASKGATPKGGRIVKLTVYLAEDTHKALKHAGIDAGKPVTRLVEDLITDFLKRRGKGK